MVTAPQEWRRHAETLLRDALDFLRTNPAQLSDVERRGWLDRLRRIEGVPTGAPPLPSPKGAWSPQIDTENPAEVADLLRQVHGEVGRGLRALLRDGGAWELPEGTSRLVAHVIQQQPVRRRYYLEAVMRGEGANIITNLASLVAAVGESLRECARCQTVFLGRKQGIYCGAACQQAEMVERKTARRRQERRKPRTPHVRRRQKKGA